MNACQEIPKIQTVKNCNLFEKKCLLNEVEGSREKGVSRTKFYPVKEAKAGLKTDRFKYAFRIVEYVIKMETASLEKIYNGLMHLQKDMDFVKKVIAEDFELSDKAKKDLKEARSAPAEEFTSQEDMEKEFL